MVLMVLVPKSTMVLLVVLVVLLVLPPVLLVLLLLVLVMLMVEVWDDKAAAEGVGERSHVVGQAAHVAVHAVRRAGGAAWPQGSSCSCCRRCCW